VEYAIKYLSPSEYQHAQCQCRAFAARVSNCSDEELAARDIAETNLQCALGLPGAEDLDIFACLKKLDAWAQLVRQNTETWWPMFIKSPQDFDSSAAHFRMMALVTVLQRDLGVLYNLSFSEGEYNGTDSRNLFIHGILSGHGGTCVTMPVLYAAIGRRLGYPLKLVQTKEHIFVRWDDPRGERFNIEATSVGYMPHDDEYYKTWPYRLNSTELNSGVFLKSLSPRQELGLFLYERAICLCDNLQFELALESLHHASQFDPGNSCIEGRQAIVAMMHSIDENMNEQVVFDETGKFSDSIPTPRNDWESWALPYAKNALERIYRIHGQSEKRHASERKRRLNPVV
jgi:regulator of sirC expression with transglutaminase-like and TPR domain